MNLKSYSRGIGAGIIVTAVIMGIASNKKAITDEEVIARAKELGYTQSSVLTQASASTSTEETSVSISDSATSISIISIEEDEVVSLTGTSDMEDEEAETSVSDSSKEDESDLDDEPETDDTSISNSGSEDSSVSVSDSTSDDSSASDSDDEKVEEPVEEPEKPQDDDKPLKDGDSVVFSIYKGDSSVVVARRMYEAGLVESAVEFDKFLCENGYDKYLCVGDYDIMFGLDFETMAKIITRRKLY